MKTIDYFKIAGITCFVVLRTELWQYFGNEFYDSYHYSTKYVSIIAEQRPQTNCDDIQEKNYAGLTLKSNNQYSVTGSVLYTHCH